MVSLAVRSLRLAVLLALLPGCYASHEIAAAPDAATACDPASRPSCAARAAACDPLALVDPVCDEAARAWRCPAGSGPTPPSWPAEICVPLEGHADIVHEAPIPVQLDGRCAWWFPALELEGTSRAHVLTDAPAPGAGCGALTLPAALEPALALPEDVDLAGVSVAIRDASGEPRPLVRGWALDPSGGFGVRALGVSFAHREGSIFVLGDRWLFDPETEDFGDAALVHEGHAYVYGCPGPPEWLEEDCFVARAPLDAIDDPAAFRVLGARGWGEGAPRRVFGSGPHRGPVVRDPRGSGFLHVYAVGFGTRLEITRAERPEGPWSPPRPLVSCELPAGDPEAYCAGPGVHVELHDPRRPERLVVSYSIGTLAPDGPARRARDPRGYSARVVAVTRP